MLKRERMNASLSKKLIQNFADQKNVVVLKKIPESKNFDHLKETPVISYIWLFS